jgi:hypothetical protein
MPSKFDENTKFRAVRLVRELARDDHETESAAMRAISARQGMSAEALRGRVRQSGVDAVRRRACRPRPPASSVSYDARTASLR